MLMDYNLTAQSISQKDSSRRTNLMELGEAYKQHNRHFLRGYLLAVEDSAASPLPARSTPNASTFMLALRT